VIKESTRSGGLRRQGALALGILLAGGITGCHATGPDDRGQRLYANICQACHQRDGSGVSGMQPPLAGTPVPIGEKAVLLGWVMYGERPAALPRGVYRNAMPQFYFLKDEDLAAILTYVRSHFGNTASVVTADDVAQVRHRHPGT